MRFSLSCRRVSVEKGKTMSPTGHKVWLAWRRDESGAVAVITALCLLVFLMLLALVLDIGHIVSVRSELQNAADASALAGARELFRLDPDPSGRRMRPFPGNPACGTATTVAGNLINLTDAQDIAIAPADVELGHWGWHGDGFPLNQFTPLGACSTNVNAIRVKTRKDASLNQPVTTWFARVLGIETVDVGSREAVAAVGYLNGVVPGRVFPIAINFDWLKQILGQPVPSDGIKLNPDGQDNGGWASPIDQHPTAANLRDWITNGFPEQVTIDNLINLNNGTVDSAIQEVKQQLGSHKQTYTVGGNNYDGWMVLAPVVEVDKFNRSTNVIAYQAMIITDVDARGNPKTIQVVFYDQPVVVNGGIPGGAPSKLLADIPRLVQ